MPANFLLKVADVLEEAAKVVDSQEAEKTAAVKKARESALKIVAEKYAEATGEELPEEILNKLASSDDDIVSTVQKMVEKTASNNSVESLGRSSEQPSTRQPSNKKEAAEAAWERFGSYINS